MDIAEVDVDRYVIVTELGIKKTHDLDVDEKDVEIIIRAVRNPKL